MVTVHQQLQRDLYGEIHSTSEVSADAKVVLKIYS